MLVLSDVSPIQRTARWSRTLSDKIELVRNGDEIVLNPKEVATGKFDNGTESNSNQLQLIDPQKLPPPPSFQDSRPFVTLSELPPGKYVDVVARIAFIRSSERQDSLGSKMVFTGIIEDSTFKVPFVSHKIGIPLSKNSVYKFQSAYVHEFEKDKSLVLVATEFSKIEPRSADGTKEFAWNPKIAELKRPVNYINLQGIVTTVYANSGLIRRCNKCNSIMPFDDNLSENTCPNKCQNEGWSWDFRISTRLYDGSGAMRMVLTRDLASKVMKKNLSEIMMLANVATVPNGRGLNRMKLIRQNDKIIAHKITVPNKVEVIEAVTENAGAYRKSDRFIVADLASNNLVFLPLDEDYSQFFSETTKRTLDVSDGFDFRIVRKLVEKALDMAIRTASGRGMMHGMYQVEAPSVLYNCEKAKLYCGFSARLANPTSAKANSDGTELNIIITPQCLVRESVLDYIAWRRSRGATDNGIVKALTQYKNKVIVAPSGSFGLVTELVMKKAGDFKVSDNDSRSLVQFWKEVYDIDIEPDEMPLVKVKMVNNERTFTYPASMCFFGNESLYIQSGVQKFIDYKSSVLKKTVAEVVEKALPVMEKAGRIPIKYEGKIEHQSDIKNLREGLESEVREKLYGRNIKARGSVLMVHEEPWFFPNYIDVY